MDHDFLPDAQAFRRMMSRFATGVAVMAVRGEGGEVFGMTANAIASVSLDPLLVLVCVEKKANLAERLLSAESFSLNLLGQDRDDLSDHFAGRWRGAPPPFSFSDWEGGIRLDDSFAALGCRRYDVMEGGDHWIVLGEVVALHRPETPLPPLIFYGSRYRRLAPPGG